MSPCNRRHILNGHGYCYIAVTPLWHAHCRVKLTSRGETPQAWHCMWVFRRANDSHGEVFAKIQQRQQQVANTWNVLPLVLISAPNWRQCRPISLNNILKNRLQLEDVHSQLFLGEPSTLFKLFDSTWSLYIYILWLLPISWVRKKKKINTTTALTGTALVYFNRRFLLMQVFLVLYNTLHVPASELWR